MARNEKVNEFLKSYASQGLTVGQIKAELKAKRMKATDSHIAYYVNKARKELKGGTVKGEAVTVTFDASRLLKILDTSSLTDSEKVLVTRTLLKAKPTA